MKNQTGDMCQIKSNLKCNVDETFPPRKMPQSKTLSCSAISSMCDRSGNGTIVHSEPDWLQRKLRNIKRLAELEDFQDLLFAELYIAFEILARRFCSSSLNPLREKYLATADDVGVRQLISHLKHAKVISKAQANCIQIATNKRNRLFHGQNVFLDDWSFDGLSKVLLRLLKLFEPANCS